MRAAYIKGANRQHPLAFMSQHFLGHGRGKDRWGKPLIDENGKKRTGLKAGGLQWTHDMPTAEQVDILVAATTTALERLLELKKAFENG